MFVMYVFDLNMWTWHELHDLQKWTSKVLFVWLTKIKDYGGIHMTCMTGYALLMWFVNICDNSVIHWAVVAQSFHIFSFIVRRIAWHYTYVKLAGWLLKSPILLIVVLHIEQVLSLKIMCELDNWFKC